MSVSKLTKAAALSLVFLFLFSSQSLAQNNNKNDVPISDEHYEILEKRKNLIERELSSRGNEWSGVYQLGDHHPTVFMWSADQGFLTWGSNHTFYPSRINFGKAKFSNDRLIIEPEISKDHLNFQYVPTELVPVKWGEQHFLIASDELMNFAYAVHSGAESQIVEYLAKSEDYRKSRTGLPNLPKEYERILKMKAVKARITAINQGKEGEIYGTEIVLNVGSKDNAGKGMVFYFTNSKNQLSAVITDLRERTSIARINGIASMADGDEDFAPRIGMKFTSKIPNGFFEP